MDIFGIANRLPPRIKPFGAGTFGDVDREHGDKLVLSAAKLVDLTNVRRFIAILSINTPRFIGFVESRLRKQLLLEILKSRIFSTLHSCRAVSAIPTTGITLDWTVAWPRLQAILG